MELDGIFKLPKKLPPKFEARSEPFEHGFWIKSMPHIDLPLKSLASFAGGFWITRDDLTVRGGTRALFGIPIDDIAWPLPPTPIRVAYHGTARENIESIRKTSLRPSFGQLGTGIYIGSFWKACRFAGRDQSYLLRENPVVIRILCIRENQISFPRFEACACKLCEMKSPEQAQACGHTLFYDSTCAELRIGQFSTGKWITQNEEWVIPPSFLLRLSEFVELNKSTIAKPNYDPLQRDIQIL